MNSTTSVSRTLRLTVTETKAATDIFLGRGLLGRAEELLARFRGHQIVVVSDSQIHSLYGLEFRHTLEQAGFIAHGFHFAGGEANKNLETMMRLYEDCRRAGIDRDSVIISFGGGVVGDVAGMLASTYLRGLEFVQIPTSLVAMVSASVGGKVGVNFADYKNLIGAFKQPAIVMVDTQTLATLPRVEQLSGLGELLTVGVLGAPEIFFSLEADGAGELDALIFAAIRCKKEIVEADPFDRLDTRARLNLGHTFGHALEKLSNFALPHGLAVAVGLHIASRLAADLEICPVWLPERIRQTLLKLGLPATLRGFDPDRVIEAMRGDKKRAHGRIRWVLPTDIGKVTLFGEESMPPALLRNTLRDIVLNGEQSE